MTKILAMPGEGERLDRFELVAELASGGMATVYLARFVGVAGFKRFVAIKRLHPHLAKEHDFIQMFLDEARLASRLHHPNVVPILEIGMHDEQYYLVMEYIEGDTVGHLMARSTNAQQTMPLPIAVRIMLDTLTGLHAAHELADEDGSPLDIVHRDVSPQNILVGVDGVARITDFGVAKAQARLANATQGGQLKGKLAYMSPEQVRGNVPVDRRADVFAAGIVLWELITGQRLFKADGEAETLFKVMMAEVPRLAGRVPPEVEAVVTRALAANPTDRFASAADFAEALEHAGRQHNLVATVRTTAQFVHETIGIEISQQREIVRAWLGRSEVSKSGVARAQGPITPEQAAPLVALVDDELEMSTRVDDPETEGHLAPTPPQEKLPQPAYDDDPFDKTRVAPTAATTSGPYPALAPPVLSMGGARPVQGSIATAREFQPFGAQAVNNPILQTTLPSPQTHVRPATTRGLTFWVLIVALCVFLVAASVASAILFRRMRSAHSPEPTHVAEVQAPAPTQSHTVAEPPPQAPVATVATVAETPSATSTATDTAPAPTASAQAAPTAQASQVAASQKVSTPPLRPTSSAHRPVAIDNHEFGGRR